MRKGCTRVNMVEMLGTYVWKWKNGSCESSPGMGGKRIKGNDAGVNSTMIYCKNFCKCHNVAPVQQ
jgi:hypothetical protein